MTKKENKKEVLEQIILIEFYDKIQKLIEDQQSNEWREQLMDIFYNETQKFISQKTVKNMVKKVISEEIKKFPQTFIPLHLV